MKHIIPLCILFLVGCPATSDDDTGGNLAVDLTMADLPSDLLDTIESLSAQITALQTAQNLTQTDVLALTGRVDALELRMDEAEVNIDDLASGNAGGAYYYDVSSANTDGCVVPYGNWDALYTKVAAVEWPFIALFQEDGQQGFDSWEILGLVPVDYTDCAYITYAAPAIVVNGELQVQASIGQPTWSTGWVAVIPLSEPL